MPERFLGKTLGKFRVDGLVGSGGFAWVYKAFDPELDITVALKVLKPQFAGDPQIEQRFRREASTAAKLRHPNIITIHAVGREGDAVYFAMDYLPDGLAHRLDAISFLPEESVLRVGVDVASALGFAHRQGVIHRDIKVDNILFDAHGNAVVADFGIARAVQGHPGQTGTNMVVGTPQYFAPEQARARPLDGRADLYSLGVTLYRAATGQLPFNGDDWYEIARQHVETPPPPPRSFNPVLSEGFERVVLHCLEKKPEDRPASGEALRQELADLLQHSVERTTLRSRIASDEPTLVVAGAVTGRTRWPRIPRSVVVTGLVVAIAAISIPAVVWRAAPHASPVSSPAPAPIVPPARADSLASSPPVRAGTESGTVRRRLDSVVSTVLVDSSLLRAHIIVTAPPAATVSLNGVALGTGTVRVDTLRPGTYEFAATLPGAADSCEGAHVRATRTLKPGRPTTLALNPVACGALSIVADPANARFLLTTPAGETVHQGQLPLSTAIVVPVGRYRLRVAHAFCEDYTDDSLTVAADGAPRTYRMKLFCSKP